MHIGRSWTAAFAPLFSRPEGMGGAAMPANFVQDPSLSPVSHFRLTNALWRELNRPSDRILTHLIKSPLLYGLELFCDRFHRAFLAPQAPVLNVLITAGGTKEPIDDVRFITNFSSGALGRAFANHAAWRGHNVVILAPGHLERLSGPLHPNVEHRSFTSTASLQRELLKAAAERRWDLVLHSAAVSDYTPAEVAKGKIASKDHDTLTVELVKTPKLLASFREWFHDAFLVGFKLLSGLPDEERLEIARQQLLKYGTDMCFENDLTGISKHRHESRLVTSQGEILPVPPGDKFAVAGLALNDMEKRARRR
jgi:phosphopantothenoylcysteine decarboxylase/phosphopantothenate--cysteine ligase